jgi:deoxyribonuclease-2
VTGLTALNEAGEPVDWWFAYKVPQLTKDADTVSATGYEYLYFDANAAELIQSPNLLTSDAGAVRRTLDSVFKAPADTVGWITYNDEQPDDATKPDNGADGHTKGVLAFDTATGTGFWLLHSWPKFPDPAATAMPTPIYGQTFLCLSLALPTLEQIAGQMLNHQVPQVYNPRVPAALPASSPLAMLAQPLNPNPAADSNVLELATAAGMAFKVIAKNREWGKDFWNDLVGPTLQSDMDVETWIRGKIPPTLDSDGIHKTFDVKYIDLAPLVLPFTWPETHDHAKWGVTVDSDWVCVGDINRMVSQEKRGGGTIALQSPALWAALQKTDLLVAPPGHSRVDAAGLITATHQTTSTAAPAAGKAPS